jgi:hypothetical protein
LWNVEGQASGFGLSWRPAIGGGTGSNQGLEKLGFPWILSSESSLFNGLRAHFCENIFVSLPGRRGGARRSCRAGRFAIPRLLPNVTARCSRVDFRHSLLQSDLGRSLVSKPFDHEAASRSRQENVCYPIHEFAVMAMDATWCLGQRRRHHAPDKLPTCTRNTK